MSVAIPIIDTWDGANRRAYLTQGLGDFFPIEDLYHEYRYARRTDEDLRKYNPLLRAEGNVPKGAGAYTPRYVVLIDGFKLVPYNESTQLNQLGDIITDDPDIDPSLYDISQLTTAKPIFIKPSEAETIQLNNESIVFASFQGAVWVDVLGTYDTKGSPSQPNGNTERPVNNIPLAISIAEDRGFNTIKILGDITLTTGDNLVNYTLIGQNPIRSTITIEPGANMLNTEIFEAYIEGELDGNVIIKDSVIGDVQIIAGVIHNCAFASTATISLSNGAIANFLSCYSGTPGLGTPTIDMNGSGTSLGLRAYSGGIRIINKTGSEAVSADFISGQIILDNTITSGIIVIRGVCHVTDNSQGADVYDHTIDSESIPKNVWDYSAASFESGSIGEFITRKVLTVSKFLGLK